MASASIANPLPKHPKTEDVQALCVSGWRQFKVGKPLMIKNNNMKLMNGLSHLFVTVDSVLIALCLVFIRVKDPVQDRISDMNSHIT